MYQKKNSNINSLTLSEENFENQINQVDALVNDTRLLLMEEDIQEIEGVRASLEALENWMNCYRSGLAAANRLSTRGADILKNIQDRLEDALETEAHQGSIDQAKALNNALTRLERLMFPVGQMFCIQHSVTQ